MNDTAETTQDDALAPKPDWNPTLVWSVLGLIGWLAFELTAHPGIAAAILCCRFGWNDFLTAIWLRRRDPHKGRGRACSWFCLAAGVKKIVTSAFLLALLLGITISVVERVGPQQNANPQFPGILLGPWTVLGVGFPMLELLTFIGCVSARLKNVRVWVDEPINTARRNGTWPPTFPDVAAGRLKNPSAPWGLMLAVAPFLVVTFAIGGTVWLLIGVLVFFGPLFGLAVLFHRVIAKSPDDCWGDMAAGIISKSRDVSG